MGRTSASHRNPQFFGKRNNVKLALEFMSESEQFFRVGLGVSGGIAAYKAVEVLRLLQKAGCDVSVAMTRHATEF